MRVRGVVFFPPDPNSKISQLQRDTHPLATGELYDPSDLRLTYSAEPEVPAPVKRRKTFEPVLF